MSLDMHVFLSGPQPPSRAAWQNAIDALGLTVQLYPAMDLATDSGFSPTTLNGTPSGFEIYIESASAIIAKYPNISGQVVGRGQVISLRWGGDLAECACVLAATAGLVSGLGAVAYYPADDLLYVDAAALVEDFKQCV
jgi:hypothetical protein